MSFESSPLKRVAHVKLCQTDFASSCTSGCNSLAAEFETKGSCGGEGIEAEGELDTASEESSSFQNNGKPKAQRHGGGRL